MRTPDLKIVEKLIPIKQPCYIEHLNGATCLIDARSGEPRTVDCGEINNMTFVLAAKIGCTFTAPDVTDAGAK